MISFIAPKLTFGSYQEMKSYDMRVKMETWLFKIRRGKNP